ncbi:hypothetical protein [Arthrobacter sp. SO3]|nr:hypothetical protein [Arthrobacter sp. SO3]
MPVTTLIYGSALVLAAVPALVLIARGTRMNPINLAAASPAAS